MIELESTRPLTRKKARAAYKAIIPYLERGEEVWWRPSCEAPDYLVRVITHRPAFWRGFLTQIGLRSDKE